MMFESSHNILHERDSYIVFVIANASCKSLLLCPVASTPFSFMRCHKFSLSNDSPGWQGDFRQSLLERGWRLLTKLLLGDRTG